MIKSYHQQILMYHHDDFIELQHDPIAVNKDQLALIIKYMKKELNLSIPSIQPFNPVKPINDFDNMPFNTIIPRNVITRPINSIHFH